MYIPEDFRIDDTEEAHAFIEEHAFGQLISMVEGRIFSSHVPFLISEDKTSLFGHLARQNPQHNELHDREALVTFEGPHDYISPSWYAKPGVPTWNYQSVHIYGLCEVVSEQGELKRIVDALTTKYEASLKTPWQPSYSETMLNAIVGFKITITELQCKYKLSQNKTAVDRAEVARQLRSLGSVELALAMEQNEL